MTGTPGATDCPQQIHVAASRKEAAMFGVSMAFLVLTALAIHHFERTPEDLEQGRLLGWLFVALWLPIFLEAVLGYWRSADFSWPASRRLLLIWLIPPYRLALSTYPPGRCLWLPGVGWRAADKALFDLLERAFSIPMLFIAMMILPILAIELLWARQVAIYPGLALALDLGIAMIWLAFTVEFILMSALAENKWAYVGRHWVNLAIIVLPFLAFVRGFQFVRLLRLGKLSRALKVYRLRGLGLRAWRGVVALELIERILLRDRDKRLRHLKRKLRNKEWELEQIRRRIRSLEDPEDGG